MEHSFQIHFCVLMAYAYKLTFRIQTLWNANLGGKIFLLLSESMKYQTQFNNQRALCFDNSMNMINKLVHFSSKTILIGMCTFHAAGVSRRQVKNVTKVSKISNILEFGDYIWNHHEKCIQISTNMPGIGLEMCEMLRILRNKTILYGWGNRGRA